MSGGHYDVIGIESWVSDLQDASPRVDRALASLAQSLRREGSLSSEEKGIIVASIAASKGDSEGCHRWVESFCGEFTEWRILAALLFLSRGAPAARTLLTATGSPSEISSRPTTSNSPDPEEIAEYFLEVFGQIPARVTLLQEHAPEALETYFLLREETLGGRRLDPRLAQLALVGVNAADRQEDFTYEHALGAVKEKASAGQLVEAGVCAMLYGGLASWTTAAAAITRVLSNSDDHTF
jgi:alkylhydroperoxidase/carboxymuconolactone decarboxylase family protein YurZ